MLQLLKWLLMGLIGTLLVVFAVVNRHDVVFSLYPLPYEIALPAYLFAVILFVLGFICAGFFAGIKHIKLGRSARRSAKRAEALEEETLRLRQTTLPLP